MSKSKKSRIDEIDALISKLQNVRRRITSKGNAETGKALNEHAYRLLKYSKGGEIAAEVASMIPGVGSVLSPVISLVDGLIGEDEPQVAATPQYDNTSFMKNGGKLYANGGEFRSYDMPSHEQGGGMLDAQLNPTTTNPIAELEKTETTYKDKGGDAYVYSDNLKHTSGMTFAEKSRQIAKKYARGTDIDKEGLSIEMDRLSKQNDMAREQDSATQFAGGGPLAPLPMRWTKPSKDWLNPLPMASIVPEPGLNDPRVLDQIDTSPKPLDIPVRPLDVTPKQLPKFTGFRTTEPEADVKKPFNYNTIAAGLKGISLLSTGIDALRKPEQDKLRLNPKASEVEGLMESRSIDFTPLVNEADLSANVALDSARNVVGNAAGLSARANSIMANRARQVGNLKLQQQQTNNQYRADEAQIKSRLGAEERAYRRETDIANMQNEAARRNLGRKFFSDLSQVGSTINKFQNNREQIENNKQLADATIREGLAILSGKYKDFGLSEDLVEKLRTGKYDKAEFGTFFDALIKYKG